MKKEKQAKGKRQATNVSLPSSTNGGGGEKGSGSMKTTVGAIMIIKGSLGPRKETVSTPVTSNSTKQSNARKKKNVLSLEKEAVKTMIELFTDIFHCARDVKDAIEKEKDEEITKKLMNSSFENSEKKTRSERKKNNKKEKKANNSGGEVDEVNKPITINNKTLEDVTYLKENPKVMNLLLSIEDMMVDYRTTNVDSMNADNKAFHQATVKMVNSYYTSTTKIEKMYKRYQDMWVSYEKEKNHKVHIKKRPT